MAASRPDWAFRRDDTDRAVVRTLAPGIVTNVFPGEHSMLSFATIEPDSRTKRHSHPEEQWGILLEGECVRIQGDDEVRMSVGDFWYTPGGVEHAIRTDDHSALVLDVFSPPRPDYRTEGEGLE